MIDPAMIDLDKARADTPGCSQVAHFNNAGSSLPPRVVVDTMVEYLRFEELTGGYESVDLRADQLQAVYASAAKLLGASANEIALTNNASDSWWRAFTAVPLEAGDRVLVGRSEFQTGAFGLLQARQRGVIVEVIPNDPNGVIDLAAMAEMLSLPTKLVCLTHISMSNGCVQPAAAVGKLVANSDAIYLLDSCQAAGQMPLDVSDLQCDFLTFTGRKFMRGPRGTGVLYTKPSVLPKLGPAPFVDGRSAYWSDAETYEFNPGSARFEVGEIGVAGRVGLGAAIDYALDLGLDHIEERITALSGTLRSGLNALPGVTVRDESAHLCGIVTFTKDGSDPSVIQAALSSAGVNVSVAGRFNAQLDLGGRGLESVVRSSVHYYNSEAEIAKLLAVVAEL